MSKDKTATSTEDLNRSSKDPEPKSMLDKLVYFCLINKLFVFLIILIVILWGLVTAPFDWDLGPIPRNEDSKLFGPVAVDAIPDIGENQQIVFTKWMGRSPQDIEDQISYPLTVAMLGIPGVKTVRTYSMFGFSTIYVIFKEDIDFYWSRSRLLEKLNSLPADSLPDGVQPSLGPDATALGQVYWYTLEGRDGQGNPVGGWNPDELRSIQDWYVRYSLMAADGISEVASIGGHALEYQIDVDPDAMRSYGVKLSDVFNSVKMSNVDVGARTIEINQAEYVIRGLGFIKNTEDINDIVVKMVDNVPIYVRNVANVIRGPALRRGALDKGGAEATGGVAVVRFGENPLAAIKNLKKQIEQVAPGLPAKAVIDYTKVSFKEVVTFAEELGFEAFNESKLNNDAWLKWLRKTKYADRPEWIKQSKVTIVPFYDRSGLIYETLGTLNTALSEEIIVTIIVILTMLLNFRSSIVISLTLPLAVLVTFIAMKVFNIDANIVALSGIAIAIGTIVDMGVIISENILKHLEKADPEENSINVVYRASSEVASAVVTAILTTIISFMPVFTMLGAEGKLFKPLAFTKTFALLASVLIAITIVPAVAHTLFTFKFKSHKVKTFVLTLLLATGLIIAGLYVWWAGLIISGIAVYHLVEDKLHGHLKKTVMLSAYGVVICFMGVMLTNHWLPLGPGAGFLKNFLVVTLPIASLLSFFVFFRTVYPRILGFLLKNKTVFLLIPTSIVMLGISAWLGVDSLLGWLPEAVKKTGAYSSLVHTFPGFGKEFMPDLDEGSYLYMPTTMPHASIGEAMDVLSKQDMAFSAIPEVENAVGKIGRVDSALDPAPVSMIETVINYKPEYLVDKVGHRLLYKFDQNQTDLFRTPEGEPVTALDGKEYLIQGKYLRDENNVLIEDDKGMPFKTWRPSLDPELNPGRDAWKGIVKPDDIWDLLVKAGKIPGTTSAPKLQPIAARIVMLQSGMRAPMGLKIKGPDLATIDAVGLQIEKFLKEVPSVEAAAVFADRIVGKPYLEIDIDRKKIARYGIHIRTVQDIIEIAIGGRKITTTVEGRERYPVRVRYMRELRDTIESLKEILVTSSMGQQIPLGQVADINYTRGPQVIKSEDTFLVGYVLFDKKPDYAEVDVVENAKAYLEEKMKSGELIIPDGVKFEFAGNYQNQIRAQKTLSVVLPMALFAIFLILYYEFKSVFTTLNVFSAIIVAWAGGFIMLWLYGQPWFMNIDLFGANLRDLFQMKQLNMSVAIWVGFLALFGIASDDGVVITSYLTQSFKDEKPKTIAAIRQATVDGAARRIRPCMMTSATTILALLPVLTSSGRGADIMVPMAIPSFGGMLFVLISSFVVPVLFCSVHEIEFHLHGDHVPEPPAPPKVGNRHDDEQK